MPSSATPVQLISADTNTPLTMDQIAGTTPLTAGTDRSTTVGTTSGSFVAANANRKGLNIQNVGANNVGINEVGGAASIGSPGTYTLVPGALITIRTNRAISAIAATAPTAITATEF